jgi:hypothetical protein
MMGLKQIQDMERLGMSPECIVQLFPCFCNIDDIVFDLANTKANVTDGKPYDRKDCNTVLVS